ncbi:MAG TPA: hypothetical protein VMM36_00555 [Opitutaceae bacterium]|nr:hypothetical protein [Opitutaceae bacterium]
MRILFDQGVPKPLQCHFAEHDVRRAFQEGWSTKRNGELLALAEQAGFDALVTTDQNLRHQQNLEGRKLAVLILGQGNWPQIEPRAAEIAATASTLRPGEVRFFPIEG